MRIPLLSRLTDPQRYDLVVIGLGSGGGRAAEFAAADLGLRVAAVERGRIGGDCLWTGCVPSKALIASARVAHTVRHADHHAVSASEPTVDLREVWARIAAIQHEIASTDDDPDRIEATGVEIVRGTARLTGPRQVTVGDRVLDTRHVLLATGSRPSMPDLPGLDSVDVLTSETLFDVPRPPDSLVMIGGGPISCELAQALQRLGVAVTVLEQGDRLLPHDEPAHADRLLRTLRHEGVDVRLGVSPTRVVKGGDGVIVHVDVAGEATSVTAQGLFVATGRTANTDGLGLDALGIETDGRGKIVVDDRNRTAVDTIHAVGDVNGRPDFTHTAGYDGVLAVRDMFLPGRGRPPAVVPWTTFTDPEIAHVGMTEAEAIAEHGSRKVTVYRESLDHNDRARADGDTNGEIVVVTVSGRVVGGHAICAHAGELVHELVLAVDRGLDLTDLAGVVHVYPTMSSTIGSLSSRPAVATARRVRPLAKLGRLLG